MYYVAAWKRTVSGPLGTVQAGLVTMGKKPDLGLLIIRLGLGIAFLIHGYPKLMGGPETWENLGKLGAGALGITSGHVIFGFLAAVAEFVGGLCLITGLLFTPACLLMAVTMAAATNMHIAKGDNFGTFSHALEAAIVFLGLSYLGPGRYRLFTK